MNELTDVLDYEDDFLSNFKEASKGRRFINYMIDALFYSIFTLVFAAFKDVWRYLIRDGNFFEEYTPLEQFLETFSSILIILFYYSILEYLLKGKTIGKFFTKTRAVTVDYERMDFKTCLIRSLCRLIPFEALSYLGEKPNGWHDRFSKTKVIDDVNWSSMG